MADFASPLRSIVSVALGYGVRIVFLSVCFSKISALWGWGLGRSFLFRPTHFVFSSVPELVWVIRPRHCGTGHVFSVFGPGLGWFLRISSCLHPQLSAGLWPE